MKKHLRSSTVIFSIILLMASCKRDIKEDVPSVVPGNNSTAQEQFMPEVAGTNRDFTVSFSSGKQSQKISAVVKNNFIVAEGDIILGSLAATDERKPVTEAVAIDGSSYRWTSSVIPFVISAGHPKKTDIEWAINHVNANTNLCVVPRTNQTDYIQFVDGSGCASYVGKKGGRQDITIGSCSPGSIAHEILHAAGLWHEQSREDRDSYITINWGNIQSGKEHNFNKHVSDGIDIGTYDYGSIMHYGKTAFSSNGQNTINIKMPPGTSTTVIGQRTAISTKDRAAINFLYKPGPCKEDCVSFNPNNVTATYNGSYYQVVDGSHSLFTAPNLTEANMIVKIIKTYGTNSSCFVGRPFPSFRYMLVNGLSPAGAVSGEDCISFNPATLTIVQEGSQYLLTDGSSRMFLFPNKIEADLALAMIKKYGFTKTCYVGRPGPSLQYMRK